MLQGLTRIEIGIEAARTAGFALFSFAVEQMKISGVVRGGELAAFAMAALVSACTISDTGLGPTRDAGSMASDLPQGAYGQGELAREHDAHVVHKTLRPR